MGVELLINFENRSCAFRPGEIITGHVVINTTSHVVTSGLTLSFHGESNVRWVKAPPAGSNISHPHHNREYRNQETYFNSLICLHIPLNDDSNSTKTFIKLPTGFNVSIPFSFQLPNSLPSSCKLAHGCVNYFAEASLKVKPTRFVPAVEPVKLEFSVLGELDLALVNGALAGIHVQQRKQYDHLSLCYWCFCQHNGELEMDLKLDKRGYLPGESVDFTLNFSNSSHVSVDEMDAYLDQETRYVTFGKERVCNRRVNSAKYGRQIEVSSNGCWKTQLEIPPNAYLTDLGGCRIMRVNYILTIKAKSLKFGSCKIKVPITVGSINSSPPVVEEPFCESAL